MQIATSAITPSFPVAMSHAEDLVRQAHLAVGSGHGPDGVLDSAVAPEAERRAAAAAAVDQARAIITAQSTGTALPSSVAALVDNAAQSLRHASELLGAGDAFHANSSAILSDMDRATAVLHAAQRLA